MRKLKRTISRSFQRTSDQGFVSISLNEYVKLHLKSNPSVKAEDITSRLRNMLERKAEGVNCTCGNPIWVIGSAEVGAMCFTCITGEAHPDKDFEIESIK